MLDPKELLSDLLEAYQQKRTTFSEEEAKQLASESNDKLYDIISLCSLLLSNRAINDDSEALIKAVESATSITHNLKIISIADKDNSGLIAMDSSSWPVNISASAWANRPNSCRNTSLYDFLGLTDVPEKLGSNLPLTEIKPHSQSSNWPSIIFKMGYNAIYTMRFPDGPGEDSEEIFEFIKFPVPKSMDQSDIDLRIAFSEGLRTRIPELPRPNYGAVSQWAEAIIDYLGLISDWGQRSFLKNFLSKEELNQFKSNLRESRPLIKKNISKRLRKINSFQK